MKFTLKWSSPGAAGRSVMDEASTVEVGTIAELHALWIEQGRHGLIVDFDDDPTIEVYNDYRE